MRTRYGLAIPCLLLTADAYSETPSRSVRVCVDYVPRYIDAIPEVGDDRLNTSPVNLHARGAELVLRKTDNTLVWSGNLDEARACTPPLLVDPVDSYKVVVSSKAKIGSNTLVLQDADGGQLYTENINNLVLSDPGDHVLKIADSPMSRVMAALTFGLSTQSIGVEGQTISIYGKPSRTDTPCPQTSCNQGNSIYYVIDPYGDGKDHSQFKSVLLHEFGHRLMFLAADLSFGGIPHSGKAENLGRCTGGDGHHRNSVEWQPVALIEGFAHFYATVVLNTPKQGGCGAYSHYPMDWDLDGRFDGHIYDCDGPPILGRGLASGDFLGTTCGGTPAPGTANEYDYQRFFWDLADKEGLTLRNVVDIISAANRPTPWLATYRAGSTDNPRDRLAAAARSLGFGAAWDRWDDVNGVAR